MKKAHAAALAAASVLLAVPPAWALHKCTTREGKVIYTEFECEKDAKTSGVVIHHSSGVDGTKAAAKDKAAPAAGAPKSGPALGAPAGGPAPGSPPATGSAPASGPKPPPMPVKDTITEMREAQKRMADEAQQRQREMAEQNKR